MQVPGSLVCTSEDDGSGPFKVVGTVLDEASSDDAERPACKVEFPGYLWNEVRHIQREHLQVATRIVEMHSEDSFCMRTMTLTHSSGSTTSTGYTSGCRAVPPGTVDVQFSVVGGREVCAVDRGKEGLPWVRVREQDSPCYPYKRELFRYTSFPKYMRYMLRGSPLSSFVAGFIIEDADDELHVSSTGSKLSLGRHLSEELDVFFALRGDEHIPYGERGKVVGATLGPNSETGYVRVRFHKSTWDLDETCMTTAEDLSCLPCAYAGCTWSGPCHRFCDHSRRCLMRPDASCERYHAIVVYNTTSENVSIGFSASNAREESVPHRTAVELTVRVSTHISVSAGADIKVWHVDTELGQSRWSPVSDILVHMKGNYMVVQRFDRMIHSRTVRYLVRSNAAESFMKQYLHAVGTRQNAYKEDEHTIHVDRSCTSNPKSQNGRTESDLKSEEDHMKQSERMERRYGKVKRMLGIAFHECFSDDGDVQSHMDTRLSSIARSVVAFLGEEIDGWFFRGWETCLCNTLDNSFASGFTKRSALRTTLAAGFYIGAVCASGGIAAIPMVAHAAVLSGAVSIGGSIAVDVTDTMYGWTGILAEQVLPETRDELLEICAASHQKSVEAATQLLQLLKVQAEDVAVLKMERKRWLLSLHPDRNGGRHHEHFYTILMAFSVLFSELKHSSSQQRRYVLALTDA